MHPQDAEARRIADGSTVELRTDQGSVEIGVEISSAMMPGVVSMPHGWGHDHPGAEVTTASSRPGRSINDVTSTRSIDRVSGCASFALPVEVRAVAHRQE